VDWSCDGKRLASGSFDKTVCIFTLANDRLSKEHTYRGHGDSVDQLCWHPSDPDLLATASGDRTVRIWESRSSKSVANIATKGENINIAWAPDGKTIAVGNKEDLVSFIDVRTHKIIGEEQFKFEVNEISWNKESDLFFLTNGQVLDFFGLFLPPHNAEGLVNPKVRTFLVTDFGCPRARSFRKYQIENRFHELTLPTFSKRDLKS
jgi:WD40 repeat protein